MHSLDNPIWTALTTTQSHFAESYGKARRFPPDVTTLAAIAEPTAQAYDSLAHLYRDGRPAALFLTQPMEVPLGWTTIEQIRLLQMVQEKFTASRNAEDWIPLTLADVPEMVALAKLTRPGPFGVRTRELGAYIGIRRNGMLAAMAGERLRMPGYTEISAVCTHPEHLGQGYAATLMSILADRIWQRGEVPVLHVREENARAIALYDRLGFKTRIVFQFAVLRVAQTAQTALP
jgi:ribosomal protein S18 acetylase RimI-like enzyme